jgi:hypothetical protein
MLSNSLCLTLKEWPRLPFTARIEGPPLYRGASASTETSQLPRLPPSQAARCASTEAPSPPLFCEQEGHLATSSPLLQGCLLYLSGNGTRSGPTAHVERAHSDRARSGSTGPRECHSTPSLIISLGEWPRLPLTARIERPPFYRGGSASKKGTWPLPVSPLESSS